ncbi:MAG TPA: asparaginase domain-containing protein [Solirubrobacteraceae bacterium]|nr:asparaginase domain-containing protein [Solirubrobacteraceae bacterium]
MRLLAAGGTIAMRGEQAVPALDADELIEQLPQLASGPPFQTETVLALPSAQLSLGDAFGLARRACAAAGSGEGVVITTGTDTMEEVAVLCALLHGDDAPIVITGANRPGSSPGADGPANLLDAVVLAGAPAAAGLGAVVAFAGEIHAAMTVRKVDSTGPTAFGSPTAGPLGRIVERRVWLHALPLRPAPLPVERLAHRVVVLDTGLGDDGALLRHAARSSDGVVLVALGAGHLPPAVLQELRIAAERVPVVITCRPDRSSMLFSTYGFEGAERDLRSSGAFCAPFLSPAAARMTLLCCLGAGIGREGIEAALAPWDAA